jgi:polyhydroxyalkanoate synthesis regulator phasin
MNWEELLKMIEDATVRKGIVAKIESEVKNSKKDLLKELELIGYSDGQEIEDFIEKTSAKLTKAPEKVDVTADKDYQRLKRTVDRLEKEKADLEANGKVLSEKLSTIETQTKHQKIKGELEKFFRHEDGSYKFYSAEEKIDYLIRSGEVDIDSTGVLVGLKDGKAIPSSDWYKGYEEAKKADVRINVKGGRSGENHQQGTEQPKKIDMAEHYRSLGFK